MLVAADNFYVLCYTFYRAHPINYSSGVKGTFPTGTGSPGTLKHQVADFNVPLEKKNHD